MVDGRRERSFALPALSELGGFRDVTSDLYLCVFANLTFWFVSDALLQCHARISSLVYTTEKVGISSARPSLDTDTASAAACLLLGLDHNRQAPESAPQPAREPLP